MSKKPYLFENYYKSTAGTGGSDEYNVQGQVAIFNSSGSSTGTTGIGNDHLYTGRQLDPETGDYYYRARYYSPILGRFISRDPLSGAEFSQGSNLYAYVGNNGVNFTDAEGMAKNPARYRNRGGHKGYKNSNKHENAQGFGGIGNSSMDPSS